MQMMLLLLLLLLALSECRAQLWHGGRPAPQWSWDTLPVAYHGAAQEA
jgi:hypothetical protein